MEWVTRSVPLDHPDFGKSFPCPVCKAPELRAIRQAEIGARLRSSGFSARHRYTFEDFEALDLEWREGKEDAYEACKILQRHKEVVIAGVTKPGICLWGDFGLGKTTLGTAAMIREANEGGIVLRIKFSDFLDDVQDAYGRKDEHSEDIIKAAQKAPLVLLDDMCDPRSRQELSPDRSRIALKFFDYRNEQLLPIIITTNCLEAQIEYQLGKQTFERVRELCHFIKVTGANLRQ